MLSVLPDTGLEFAALLGLVLVLFFLVTIGLLALWVYQDAVARGSDHPIGWAIGVGVIPFLIAGYVLARDERETEPSDREDLTLALLLGFLGAWILGSLLSPPDPASQAIYVLVLAAITLPFFYLYVYRSGNGESEGEDGADGDGGGDGKGRDETGANA